MPGTPHQAWPCLGSPMLGTHCHPRAGGFPSHPLMHRSVRSFFCTEITVGKRLQESSWQAPNLEKLLSALSPSTRSFHFLLMGTHPPSPSPVCSAPSLPSQPWHFPAVGAQNTQQVPGSLHTHLEQVYLHSVCQVPVAVSAIMECLAHGGGWTNIN